MNEYGVCNICGENFDPKIVGMKYYCSNKCYNTPIFKSKCKYCNDEIVISGKELRNRRGILPKVCLKKECMKQTLHEKECIKCHNKFIGGNLSLYCEKCSYEITHRICVHCGEEFEVRPDRNRVVCDDCVVGEKGRYVGYCEESIYENCAFKDGCSRYFYYSSPAHTKCQMVYLCVHKKKPIYCQECSPRDKVQLYNEMIKTHEIIERRENLLLFPLKDNSSLNKIYHKTCETCGREFLASGPTSNWCGSCFYELKCEACGCMFLSINKDNIVCGQACSGIYFHKNGNIANKHIKEEQNNLSIVKNTIDFESYTEITNENLNKFGKISGIWFKSSKDMVLDVCLTKDVKSEVLYHYKSMRDPPNYKYSELSKYEDIKLYWLCDIDSWEDGLKKRI